MDTITKLELHCCDRKVSTLTEMTDVGLEAASLVTSAGATWLGGIQSLTCALHVSLCHGYQPIVLKVTPLTSVCFILPGDDGIAEIYINLLFSLSNVNVPSRDETDPSREY